MRFGHVRRGAVPVIAAAVAVGLLALGASGQTPSGRVVSDSGGRFALTVPVNWQVRSPSGDVTLKATGPTSSGGLPDSVDVVARSTLFGMNTPQACVEKAEWVTQHLAHIAYTTVSSGPTTLAGYPAYSHVYTWKASTGEMRWSDQVCIVQQGQAYVITGTTAGAASGLAARTAVLKQTMASFHLLPRTQRPPQPDSGAQQQPLQGR